MQKRCCAPLDLGVHLGLGQGLKECFAYLQIQMPLHSHLQRWKRKLLLSSLGSWWFGRKVFWGAVCSPSGPWAECLSLDIYTVAPRTLRLACHSSLTRLDTKEGKKVWNALHQNAGEACCFQSIGGRFTEQVISYFPTIRICMPAACLSNFMTGRVLASMVYLETSKSNTAGKKKPIPTGGGGWEDGMSIIWKT